MESIDYYYIGLENFENSDYKSAVDFFELSNRIEEHYKTYERLFFCWKNLNEPSKAYYYERCAGISDAVRHAGKSGF